MDSIAAKRTPTSGRQRWLRLCAAFALLCAGEAWANVFIASGSYVYSWPDIVLHLSPCRSTLPVSGPVQSVEFSRDSAYLAVTSARDVAIWDLAALQQVQTIAAGPGDDPAQRRWSSFSPDGRSIATAGAAGVQVVDWRSARVLLTIPADGAVANRFASGVTFSPDGELLAVSELFVNASGYPQGRVQIFDARTGQPRQTVPFNAPLGRPALRFTPDSRHLLLWVASQLWIWDVQRQQVTARIHGDPEASLDATRLIAYGSGGTQVLSLAPDQATYVALRTVPNRCTYEKAAALLPQSDAVLAITSTPDDLWAPSIFPTACLWQTGDGEVHWQSAPQGTCVAVAPSGSLAAVCRGDIQIWRIPTEWTSPR